MCEVRARVHAATRGEGGGRYIRSAFAELRKHSGETLEERLRELEGGVFDGRLVAR